MKSLLAIFIALPCYAGGNLGLVHGFYLNSRDKIYQPYLNVNERINPNWHYESWTGLQLTDQDPVYNTKWLHTEHYIMHDFTSRIAFGGGLGYDSSLSSNVDRDFSVRIKADYKLW